MRILCHRGWWNNRGEENTRAAFHRAFENGMGVETDIRDRLGELVISHDPPMDHFLPFDEFLSIYRSIGNGCPLALNIKSDGIYTLLSQQLSDIHPSCYFVFDMSIPDTLSYYDGKEPYFTRQSEYEPAPALYEHAAGVWIDCFEREWYTEETVRAHLASGKRVCLVSPELHRRSHITLWDLLLTSGLFAESELYLCTDLPDEAQTIFTC